MRLRRFAFVLSLLATGAFTLATNTACTGVSEEQDDQNITELVRRGFGDPVLTDVDRGVALGLQDPFADYTVTYGSCRIIITISGASYATYYFSGTANRVAEISNTNASRLDQLAEFAYCRTGTVTQPQPLASATNGLSTRTSTN